MDGGRKKGRAAEDTSEPHARQTTSTKDPLHESATREQSFVLPWMR
jgi:hypothetical protein